MQRLSLFPLSAHLLPGGRMSLRIFEPRYVRMVKEVCASDSVFVVCMLNSEGDKEINTHIHPLGTVGKVIDFDVLEDGLLGVTVEGQHCVKVSSIETESDGLRVGQCEEVDGWTCDISQTDIAPMNMRLKEIFEKYPEVNALYAEPAFDDPIWVIHRWLELLPVDASKKQYFLEQKDCGKALQFLRELIE
ncbi:LON peptidase substrate-binding domain-containing protein [Alteromonas sp. ASW11-36]|uniref:LON peptidase substrate-binding domain-containing protein n=1 Tax=Alteromonas arenosi TaxID=3055817 RepID=A0ABT7SUC0_9ALTE|nr:LON peptidase substrate-binding domain-containing protein [Alteromonas sp. ASW11-36]MDM7859792.1 LON peptidase substrate-binding domain-containing protein [Alteromonas sp. ASW11-36]